MKTKVYTGIGSRNIPEEVKNIIVNLGNILAKDGFTLRSGGAEGSDESFEKGCDSANGNKEIYVPWKGFNGSTSNLVVKDRLAFDIAKKYHPYWDKLSQVAKKLQARNSHQVLGKNLKSPTNFVICYTKNGKGNGGTGQALRIAKDYNIPIFDIGNYYKNNSFNEMQYVEDINLFFTTLKEMRII